MSDIWQIQLTDFVKRGTQVAQKWQTQLPLLVKSGTKVAQNATFHQKWQYHCHVCATFVTLFTKSGIDIFGFMATSGIFTSKPVVQSSLPTSFISGRHISHTSNSCIPCEWSIAITMLACCVLHTIYLPIPTLIMLACHGFSHNTAFAATTATAWLWWAQIGSHQGHVATTIGATSFYSASSRQSVSANVETAPKCNNNSIALVCSKRLSGCQQPQWLCGINQVATNTLINNHISNLIQEGRQLEQQQRQFSSVSTRHSISTNVETTPKCNNNNIALMCSKRLSGSTTTMICGINQVMLINNHIWNIIQEGPQLEQQQHHFSSVSIRQSMSTSVETTPKCNNNNQQPQWSCGLNQVAITIMLIDAHIWDITQEGKTGVANIGDKQTRNSEARKRKEWICQQTNTWASQSRFGTSREMSAKGNRLGKAHKRNHTQVEVGKCQQSFPQVHRQSTHPTSSKQIRAHMSAIHILKSRNQVARPNKPMSIVMKEPSCKAKQTNAMPKPLRAHMSVVTWWSCKAK